MNSSKNNPPQQPNQPQRTVQPKEYKVIALRECPVPESLKICETPDQVAEYWRTHVATSIYYQPECEQFVVLMLNTRRRIKGHHLVGIGTLDSITVSSREVYRAAVISGSSAIACAHNHPSGIPDPSEADIRVTRELVRAGQILKIELVDHVIIGAQQHVSLRERGYLY